MYAVLEQDETSAESFVESSGGFGVVIHRENGRASTCSGSQGRVRFTFGL